MCVCLYEDTATGHFLGGAGLNHVNRVHRFVNLGYWVRTDQTGRGVATAAAQLAARYAIEELGFVRVEIVVEVENLASQRVADKTGARREGLLRRRLMNRENPRDAVMYSLVREDLKP